METKIIIHDYQVHPNTGHVTVLVKSHTADGKAEWDGPLMAYGADAVTFRHRFNSDPAQFENWVASEHRANMGAQPGLIDALLKRKGQVIG